MSRQRLFPCGTPTAAGRQIFALPRRAGSYFLVLVLAVLQCSCQSLTPPGSPADRASAAVASAAGPAAAPAEFRFATPAAEQATTGDEFPVQPASYSPPALPASAWTGATAPVAAPAGAGCCAGCATPPPYGMAGGWRPPGIAGTWPLDEYLFDGGDHQPSAAVLPDWTVLGLDEEDTIAHYDTLDGRTEVEPANRVPIYAPRFAAVRKISGLAINQQRNGPAGVEAPTRVVLHEGRQPATMLHQPVQAERFLGLDASQSFRESLHPGDTTGGILLDRLSARFKPHEDFQIIRAGRYDNSEKARLAQWLEAAAVWTSDQAVQVVIDRVVANLAVGSSRVQSVYHYELPEGKPRLRVLKVASRQQAQPGDEIDFTLRFDNVGDQTIGNVTLLDHLTTRLEYVPGTAECHPAANFFIEESPAGSVVLRWEIIDPLPVGEGGLARFRCRVR